MKLPHALLLLLSVGCAGSSAPAAFMDPPSTAAPTGPPGQPPLPAAPDAWQVERPPGPSATVAIDTDEGTWLSVDVSPDGTELAFDLLGDIYALPITGGDARAITSGMAWDMQPRYSPDGAWIAFTSDRSGGDNIWVMRRDGSDVRQVTKETYRLVNSPAWSPDGRLIAVRKHFTGGRSLGAGEIWLYHRSGGTGVQATERPNDEQDAGEPAFSPDGRYLYFSQDVTPGPHFEYNKDPHAGIYVIKRLDRFDGRVDVFAGGPGGAVRPTPSPDGTALAFVRRVGTRTALVVQEVESGAERIAWDGLDRDMQETWAIHGVYPQMAWMPRGDAVVLWAGGHLHRVDVASGEATEIPFRVRGEREVRQALRTPVAAHPDRLDVRMVRGARVSPDGTSVVYQALGKLYVRALPDGVPRRLTRDDDVVELAPSWSRDGAHIVYAIWHDQRRGGVRVVSARGGASRTITRTPGVYVEPAFAPDGRTVVVRRTTGGWLLGPEWSRDPGLYAVPAAGGELRLVSRTGEQPHFTADKVCPSTGRVTPDDGVGKCLDRVYFVERDDSGEEPVVRLASIGLDGRERRVHATARHATDLRLSPDGRWVAFQEQFNVHVSPFVAAGRPMKLAPGADAQPTARVSRDAGAFLHWSGDSRRLHWTLGPELYTRELRDVFAFLSEAGAPPSDAPASGTNVAFSVPADRPTGTLALVGARIVTMRGDEVIERGAIVVDGNRIAAVGPVDTVAIPRGATVVDVTGTTIIPGMIDVHAHGPYGRDGIVPQRNWAHHANLAFGVTTMHDPSSHTETVFAAAELARAGLVTSPRLYSTGTILYGADEPIKANIDSLDDARAHLRRMKAVGAFSVKSYGQPRRDQRQQIVAAARELDLMVVPEGASLFHLDMTMIVDGHTGVEHALPVPAVYADVIQLWSGTEVGYTPTLGVGYGGLMGEVYWYAESDVFAHERLRRFVPPRLLEARARRRTLASDGDWNHVALARAVELLRAAGVWVQLGAHGQREGLAAHWELWSFVQGGMSPHDALRVATLGGARYLGLAGDLGSLEPGKLADLVVIDGDVLADIRASERVRYTMVNGRLFDATTMAQLGNHPAPAPVFHWQEAR